MYLEGREVGESGIDMAVRGQGWDCVPRGPPKDFSFYSSGPDEEPPQGSSSRGA